MIDATAGTMDASCQNNFHSADRRYAAPECFREVGFFDASNVERLPNPGDRSQQVLSDLPRHVGSSIRRTVDNCGGPSYVHQYGEGPLQASNLSSVPPVAGGFNGTAHVLLASLSVLQQKARQLEAFVQEGRHDQPGIISSILHELILTAAWVLASVQGRGANPTSVDCVIDLEGIGNGNIQAELGGLGLGLGFGKPDGTNQGMQAEVTNSNNSSRCQLSEEAERKIEAMDELVYDIVEMNEDDILAEHTHFCEICGKGFRRDANVRMHMRAHGNEYKTHQALMSKPSAPDKPCRESPSRYSCPFERCRRNKNHRKFKPLKSIASLRNHYKRSHCPKMYTCNKCNKQFSVVGDLKTHGKNCGHNRWQCSCGTTFTRKDKLFGHVALFEGHRPVLPSGEATITKSDEEKCILGTENRPDFFVGDPAGLVNNTQSCGTSSGDDMLFSAGSSHQNDIDGRFCESDVFWAGFSG